MNQIEPLIQAYFAKKIAQDSAFLAFTPAIKAAILRRQEQHARRFFVGFLLVFIGSASGFVWSSIVLVHQAVAAGLGQLLGIVWSDFGSVSQFWSDLLISIGESLPMTTIMVCLGAALVAALALRATFATYEIYYKEQKAYGKN